MRDDQRGGVWADEIQALAGARGRFRVRASKGVHIVVPRDRIVGDGADDPHREERCSS